MRVLVIEDDAALNGILAKRLAEDEDIDPYVFRIWRGKCRAKRGHIWLAAAN